MNSIDFSPEIYRAHRWLSQWNVKFLEFMQDNLEGLKRSHFDTVVNHPVFNYYRLQPWPTFISRERKRELKIVCRKVFDLLKSIPERLFNYDLQRIGQYYEIPMDRCRQLFAGVDNEYLNRLVSRGDLVISPSGGIKCIEFNVNANLGGWEQDFMEMIYSTIPVISKFLIQNRVQVRSSYLLVNVMEHVLESALERFGTNPEQGINTAIVMKKFMADKQGPVNTHLKQMYKNVLAKIDNTLAGELVFCQFTGLNSANQSVYFQGKPIHIIIEWYMGKVPSWVMTAVKNGKLLLYNGPIMDIMANKLSIALLSQHENSDVFSRQEREIIKKYLPWTRKLIPGQTTHDANGSDRGRLEDFVIKHREQLVLKAGMSYGGYDVIMGAEVQPDQWKQQVEKALSQRNWVVQEYIKPVSYLYQAGETGCLPHQVVWGVFLFGDRSPGGFVRVLPEQNHSRVINLNQGSEQSITLEVEE
ncbi:MAG: hypothetical protein PVH61_19710 [Candidatus Aminicenantes bacterium]|jgi:hypothetical protein